MCFLNWAPARYIIFFMNVTMTNITVQKIGYAVILYK